ncbi:MAG: hypothetical protein HY537_12210 [Deltaproteobacteria bacterium]|nr:hypothetical protein [Deltaproteobacteria bacterium]
MLTRIVFLSLALIFQLYSGVSAIAEEADEPESEAEKVKTIKGKERELTIPLGTSRMLEFPFEYGSIDLGEDLIGYTRVDPKKLRLITKNAGFTEMTIYDKRDVPQITYKLTVTREDTGKVIAELQSLLGDIEGIKFKTVGGTIMIDGDIVLPKDMIRIMRVVDSMRDRDPKKKEIPIKNVASISKMTMNVIAERIEREVNNPDITARVLNNNIFLEGTAKNDFEAEKALLIAKNYLPEAFVEKNKGDGGEVKLKDAGGSGGLPSIVDLMQVAPPAKAPPAEDIKITMNYVELSNEYEREFNFQWKPLATDTSALSYNSQLGGFAATVVATISSLFPKLNTAKNHGHARILKTETIVVKDKSENPAVIESSVDFYARNTNDKGQESLQPITIQNATKVKASKIPGSDSLDVGIQITLNSLLGLQQGAPVIAKNSLQTQVTIRNGDSAALGGYAIDRALSGYNRSPVSNPLGGGDSNNSGGSAIFNFQRSKNFKRDKQQYVIFVTPEVIRTASAGTEDITKKFRLNAGER